MYRILLIIFTLAVLSACHEVKKETHFIDIDLRIVNINSDCSFTNDKFHKPQLCNTILFETISGEKLYREMNTCTDIRSNNYKDNNIHIDTKWLYNHKAGDTVHFDYLLKSTFFTIDK